MSDFELESWEVPSETTQTIYAGFRARVQWQGREEEAHIASVPSLSWIRRFRSILIRFSSAPDITFVVMATVWVNGIASEDDVEQLSEPTEEEIVSKVREAVAVDPPRLCRPFVIPYNSHYFVLVRGDNAEWRSRSRSPTRFRLPDFALHNPRCASKDVFEWLQTQRSDGASEMNFALKWRKDSLGHFDYVAHLRPQLVELKTLMQWVLIASPLDFELRAAWKMHDENRLLLRFFNADRTSTDCFESQDQPLFLRNWNRFFFAHFYPLPALDEALPLCVHDWFAPNIAVLLAQVARPTQHERIEAGLKLREWLQQNAPDRMDLLPS